MITTTQMYWLVTLDSLIHMGVFLSVVFTLATFAMIGLVADTGKLVSLPVVTALLAIFFMLVVTFTPTTKQMAAIVVVPKIVNNEKMQVAGDKLYALAVEWMDSLRPNKPKEDK